MVFSWGFFRSLSKCAQCLIASARAHIHKSTLKSTRTRCLAHSKVTHIAWNRFIHNMKRDCYFPHGAPTRPCFFSLFFFFFFSFYWLILTILLSISSSRQSGKLHPRTATRRNRLRLVPELSRRSSRFSRRLFGVDDSCQWLATLIRSRIISRRSPDGRVAPVHEAQGRSGKRDFDISIWSRLQDWRLSQNVRFDVDQGEWQIHNSC